MTGRLPIIQIMMYVKRTEVEENRFIKFRSSMGMSLAGMMEFKAISAVRSRIVLRFEHALPTCLMDAKIGPIGVGSHMKTILGENLATFKMLAERDLEFSEHKHDTDQIRSELEEVERAYVESGMLTEDESYSPSDLKEYSRPFDLDEILPYHSENM